MKIKVNDRIRHSLFRGKECEGTILKIEVCKTDEKYGRGVQKCDTSNHPNGVVDLDNGHWCYFYQIIKVLEDDTEREDN